MAITPTLLRPRIHAGISVNWAAAVNAQTLAVSAPLERYAAAAAWLGSHSQPGELVFQTDWDDFPRQFFYDTVNAYTVGLDPTYLQLADEQLYEDWVAITRGRVPRPSSMIADRFGGAYVFPDLDHTAFLDHAESDPGLQEICRDRMAVIYRVGPPAEGSRQPQPLLTRALRHRPEGFNRAGGLRRPSVGDCDDWPTRSM